MQIKIEKLVLSIEGGMKDKAGGKLSFELKNYEQEMEAKELLEMLKTYTELLKQMAANLE